MLNNLLYGLRFKMASGKPVKCVQVKGLFTGGRDTGGLQETPAVPAGTSAAHVRRGGAGHDQEE